MKKFFEDIEYVAPSATWLFPMMILGGIGISLYGYFADNAFVQNIGIRLVLWPIVVLIFLFAVWIVLTGLLRIFKK